MPSLVKTITPVNIVEEKEKFFRAWKRNEAYNPQFEYEWDDVKNFSTDEKQKLFETIKLQNHENIVKNSQEFFSTKLSAKNINLAKDLIKNVPAKMDTPADEEVVRVFENAFKIFRLEYHLEVSSKRGFNFRPSYRNKKIVYSKYATLDFYSLDSEVKHELAHVIRYENSKYNQIDQDKDYLPLEEGIASYATYQGDDGYTAKFQHAAEYLATEVALKGSFQDVINFFINVGFTVNLAWQRAIRHKFGFKDTSKPGDIMKPAMYFQWGERVTGLSVKDRLRLFMGRIGLSSLDGISLYRGRFEAEMLIDFFKLNG